jgi:hypothetical protein
MGTVSLESKFEWCADGLTNIDLPRTRLVSLSDGIVSSVFLCQALENKAAEEPMLQPLKPFERGAAQLISCPLSKEA